MDEKKFIEKFKDVFEHSEWIPQRAWGVLNRRNSAGDRSSTSREGDTRQTNNRRTPSGEYPVEACYRAMVTVAGEASREEKLSLLCAHPQLAGKEARSGTLTSHSTEEQSSARLDQLSREELEKMNAGNKAYLEKFGFPFIIAVRRHSKEDIFRELDRRLDHDQETEITAALEQVYEIAKIRMGLS